MYLQDYSRELCVKQQATYHHCKVLRKEKLLVKTLNEYLEFYFLSGKRVCDVEVRHWRLPARSHGSFQTTSTCCFQKFEAKLSTAVYCIAKKKLH